MFNVIYFFLNEALAKSNCFGMNSVNIKKREDDPCLFEGT